MTKENIKRLLTEMIEREFDIDEIETTVVKIYSQGYYSNVYYEIIDTPDGNILRFHCNTDGHGMQCRFCIYFP